MSTDTCNPRGPLRFLILALACVAFVHSTTFFAASYLLIPLIPSLQTITVKIFQEYFEINSWIS